MIIAYNNLKNWNDNCNWLKIFKFLNKWQIKNNHQPMEKSRLKRGKGGIILQIFDGQLDVCVSLLTHVYTVLSYLDHTGEQCITFPMIQKPKCEITPRQDM